MPDDDLEIISVSPTDSGGGDDEFLPASAVKATEGGDEFLPASAVAPAPKADIRSQALKRKRTLLSAAPDDLAPDEPAVPQGMVSSHQAATSSPFLVSSHQAAT